MENGTNEKDTAEMAAMPVEMHLRNGEVRPGSGKKAGSTLPAHQTVSQPSTPKGSPRPHLTKTTSQPVFTCAPEKETEVKSPEVFVWDNVAASSPDRKLVLHFDVRNTVLVADSVTNVNVEQALNSFLTGVTWGKEVDGQWTWFCSEPSLVPPSPDLITYYKHLEQRIVKSPNDRAYLRQLTGDFTHEAIGHKFLPHFESHLKDLRWPYGDTSDKILTMKGGDGTHYHYILPAFFKLLHHLHETNRDYCIIIRTYGLDAPNVLACTQHTILGKHPQFPKALPVKVNQHPGKVFRTKTGKICFEKYFTEDPQGRTPRATYTNEKEIYQMLSEQTGISAFVDDFIYWQDNNYHHTAAKPLWVDPTDHKVHHIIFDDNIRTTELDSIVDLRLIEGDKIRSLNLEEIPVFEDMCLVQANLLQSTSNVDYFIDKLTLCEHNYNKYLSSPAR